MPQYLTTKQVAELLQVTPRTVRRYVERGDLAPVHFGHLVRFDADAIHARLSTSKA